MPTTPHSLWNLLGLNIQGDLGRMTIWKRPNHRLVAYLATTPKEPASTLQIAQKERWKTAATMWQALNEATKQNWRDAARHAHLRCSGYALFVWSQVPRHQAALRTIAANTKQPLYTA